MIKVFIRAIIALLLCLVMVFIGLAYWLFSPLDQQTWRVQLTVPYVGNLHLRGYPLLQLATSLPGREFLNGSRWQSNHGLVILNNHAGLVDIVCEECRFSIPELSPQPIELDRISLSVRHNQQQLSGIINIHYAQHDVRLLYVGQINMQGVRLKWTLPKTPLVSLLAPLKTHSSVLQKAYVRGSLTATGTLQWPSRIWSINPELQGFEVAGLGTEKLKYSALKYRCHVTQTISTPETYIWTSEKNMGRWLPKAVLIAEDTHFMQHPGYDMDILRYLVGTENRGNAHNKMIGGSTITQQLAKNFFTGGERNWIRKLEELLYAVEMEHTLGKRRIFALYLNTVDWGPNICGANQAAKVYFGLTPSQLSPVQAAWLAGILRNPHRAWQQEYLPNDPNMERLSWVMRYMPKKAQPSSLTLKFTRFETMN